MESLQDFAHMLSMLVRVLGIDQYVVQVYDHAHVQHVLEDIIHKTLKRCWSVRKAIVHDLEFIRTVASAKSGFPFISISNADQVVCSSEINFGEDMRGAQSVEEIWDQW